MSDAFVPLTASKLSASGGGFVPLRLSAVTAEAGQPSAAPAANGQHTAACDNPSVTLIRQGDVVSAIRVQCACGRVIELNCVY